MFERLTDRARKVMAFTKQEAQRFKHEYIAPEHILLGLLREHSCVGAILLRNLGVDIRDVRVKVYKVLEVESDHVSMGILPQTPKAKKVIEHAIYEARSLHHGYVGTEHLLLGLLRVLDARIRAIIGIDYDQVREAVETMSDRDELPEARDRQHRSKTHILHVRLDIESASSLSGFTTQFVPHGFVAEESVYEDVWHVRYELHEEVGDPVATLEGLCDAVESLTDTARELWEGALRRDFSIGIRGGAEPQCVAWPIEPALLRRVADLDAQLVIWIYAASDDDDQDA